MNVRCYRDKTGGKAKRIDTLSTRDYWRRKSMPVYDFVEWDGCHLFVSWFTLDVLCADVNTSKGGTTVPRP